MIIKKFLFRIISSFLLIIFFNYSAIANENLYETRFKEYSIKTQEVKKNSKPCKGDNYVTWDNCFGEYDFPRGKYKGQWSKGNIEGTGMFVETWGAVLFGSFKNNRANGEAVYFLKDGNFFKGEFKEDLVDGKAIYTEPSGYTYEGQWKKMKAHGYGIEIDADGNKYEGQWKEDLYHGKGKQTFETDVDLESYEGEFFEGKRKGKGKSIYHGGTTYIGEFDNNWENGYGIMTYVDDPDGWLKYEGEWVEGYENGAGTLEFVNGNKYIGNFQDSRFHGKGKFIWGDGEIYEGEWENGYRDGLGVYKYKSGTVYRGEFADNLENGEGVLTYADGSVYKGQFKDGLMHGKGIMKYANGDVYNGLWKDDWEHGQGIMTYANGNVYEGLWQEGNKAEGKTTLAKFETDENYYALIIGNNNYQNLEKLDAAVNDAKGIEKVLKEKYGFKTKLLIDANYNETANEIIKFTKDREANDNLLIYYAGHGELEEDENRGYWLPVDAGSEQDAKWLVNDSIKNWVRSSKAKHILLIVDSCFAGALMRGNSEDKSFERLSKTVIDRNKKLKTRVVMTSGGNTPVVDSDGGEHSYFADKLIRVLENNTDVIQTSKVFQDVRRYVIDNAEQTPNYSQIFGTGHDGGEFLFFPKS